MRIFDWSFSTPEENLACDEALLDSAEEDGTGEVLRFWESSNYFVVVGYANRIGAEVDLDFCEKRGIAVFRRCSGGGTVLQGPGCLNYSLILRITKHGPFRGITATNQFVLRRHKSALSGLLGVPIEVQGHTDLAINRVKFSGNAQRRRRHFLLFHGSFLLDMDIGLIQEALPMPSKAPEYRSARSHTDFLLNLKIPGPRLRGALSAAWGATEPFQGAVQPRISLLVARKYQTREWNYRF